MKTQIKYISNFKFNKSADKNDDMQIDYFENINLENSEISTETRHCDLLGKILNGEELDSVKENNSLLLTKITQIIPYDYLDETTNNSCVRLFVIDHQNNLYELNFSTFIFAKTHEFSQNPKVVFNKNSLYLFGKNECVVIGSKSLTQVESLPNLISFSEANNQLFFITETNPYNVYQSEETELKNLSNNLTQYQSHEINSEDGAAIKLVTIKSKLYLITQYSILKFDSELGKFISQNNLQLNIFHGTTEMIDDKVFFYTSNGLYSFDGNNIERLTNNYLLFQKNAKSICFNQNYYIFSTNYPDFLYKYENNTNYFVPLKFKNIANIYQIKSKDNYNLCICDFNNNTYKNITLDNSNSATPETQTLSFKTTLFGTSKLKQLVNLHLRCDGAFCLKIKSDVTESEFNISNSTTLRNVSINGTMFDFTIYSQDFFKLKSILIEYAEVGE